jgi:hypothetical protein
MQQTINGTIFGNGGNDQRRYYGPNRRKPLLHVSGRDTLSNDVNYHCRWADEFFLWIEVAVAIIQWIKGGCK